MTTTLRLVRLSPVQQLQRAVKVIQQRGTAFNPVAVVAVQHAVDVAHPGAVDVSAHHALVATASRVVCHCYVKVGHKAQSTSDFLLQVRLQRPIRQPMLARKLFM